MNVIGNKKLSGERKSKNNNLSHLFNLLEKGQLQQFEQLVDLQQIDQYLQQKGYLSLIIRFLTLTNNNLEIKKIIQQYSNYFNKRDLLMLINYFYQQEVNQNKPKRQSTAFLRILLDKFELNNFNLVFLLENKVFTILKMLKGYYCPLKATETVLSPLTPFDNDVDYNNLKVHQFNQEIISHNLDIIKSKITHLNDLEHQFETILNNNKNNQYILIDGGNVLFSNKALIDLNSYQRLLLMMKKISLMNKQPILVIHQRHLNLKKISDSHIINIINQITEQFLVFKTPYHQNDDYYLLYLGLKYQVKIITNDLFGDHISVLKSQYDQTQTFYQTQFYIQDLQLKYQFLNSKNKHLKDIENESISLQPIVNYSQCIQVIGSKIAINDQNGKYYWVSG